MSSLRDSAPAEIAGYKVVGTSDYKLSVQKDLLTGEESVINLPKSNVLQYNLENEHMVIVRPSGTEPKIKLYLTAVGNDKDDASNIIEQLKTSTENILGI
jgi:phosphoglucomutase